MFKHATWLDLWLKLKKPNLTLPLYCIRFWNEPAACRWDETYMLHKNKNKNLSWNKKRGKQRRQQRWQKSVEEQEPVRCEPAPQAPRGSALSPVAWSFVQDSRGEEVVGKLARVASSSSTLERILAAMAGHSSRLYKESFTKQGEEKKESCFGNFFIFNFF